MKIDQLPSDTAATAKKSARAAKSVADLPAQTESARGAKVAQAGTPVSLSAHTHRLSSSSDTPVDDKKVAEVREQIRNGTFKINPEAIADGMLNDAQDQLSKVRGS